MDVSVRALVSASGGRSGALAVVQVAAEEESALSSALERASCGGVAVGESRLRMLGGAHEVMVSRWSARVAALTGHAGEASLREIVGALEGAGICVVECLEARETFPECADAIEARAMLAMASAASPRAIPQLLRQASRWRAWDGRSPSAAEILETSATLDRLIRPALVAAVGRTNVGKSTLLNALAGRAVSIVADEPGVTRDHVGASLTLDGVTVRWVDTPGVLAKRERLDERAWERAREVISSADVVVVCGDAASGFVETSELGAMRGAVIRVGTRSDLGAAAGADVRTSTARGTGLAELAAAVRRAIVSDAALAWAGPWAFDEGLRGRVREAGAIR